MIFSGVSFTGGYVLQPPAPPIAPPTAVTNTQLLTNFTNGAIFDNTAKNVLETGGNAQISTTQSKWGGSSMYFDGTGDYLVGGAFSAPLRAFGTGDFTIEGWFYTGANKTQIIVDTGTTSGSGSGMQVALNSSGYPYFFIFNSTTAFLSHISNTNIVQSLDLNALFGNSRPFTNHGWYQVGMIRTGGTLNFYWNGVLLNSQFAVTNNSTSASLEFGRGAGSGSNSSFESYPGVAFSNISLYNRALTQQEVLQNYNSMKTRYRQTSPRTQFGLRTIFS
jgi:hypothetical protein